MYVRRLSRQQGAKRTLQCVWFSCSPQILHQNQTVSICLFSAQTKAFLQVLLCYCSIGCICSSIAAACNYVNLSSDYNLALSHLCNEDGVILAGLWEFPGWQVESAAASDRALLNQAVDDKLPELIGITSMSALGSLQVVRRVHLGSILHTFSHIQQTMHVELLALQVCSLAFSCSI